MVACSQLGKEAFPWYEFLISVPLESLGTLHRWLYKLCDPQMHNPQCRVCLTEKRNPQLGRPVLPPEGAVFAQPVWLQWAVHSSQGILQNISWAESWQHHAKQAIYNFILNPMCSLGHYLPHQPRDGVTRGRLRWLLLSLLQDFSKTSQSCIISWHTSKVCDSSVFPPCRRAMYKNILT